MPVSCDCTSTAQAPLALVQLPTRVKAAIAKESAHLEHRAFLDLALHLNGARAAITDTHRGGGSGAVLNFDMLGLF